MKLTTSRLKPGLSNLKPMFLTAKPPSAHSLNSLYSGVNTVRLRGLKLDQDVHLCPEVQPPALSTPASSEVDQLYIRDGSRPE